MKTRYYAATVAIFVLLVTPVSAYANGPFIAVSIGNATLDDDFDGFTVDDSSTAFRLVGGWRFNKHFALEAGYHDFGGFEESFDIEGVQDTATLSADGFTFGATGDIPFAERFTLFGRAGLFFWDGDAEINGVSQAKPEDTNLYLGVGLRFDLSKKLQLTGDWTNYDLEDTASDVLSIGSQFSFR